MGFIDEILKADLPTKIIVIGIVLLALLVLFILFAIISNTSAIKKVAKELKKTSKDNKRNTIEAYIRAVRPRGRGVNPLEGIVPTETPAPAPEMVEEVEEAPAPAPVVPVVYEEPVEEVVATAEPAPEVVEEVVEEPAEEVVEEVVEETIEEPVEEVVEEPVEEPVEEVVEETAEEPVEEVVEEVVEEPTEEPVEEVVEETVEEVVEEPTEEPAEETAEEPLEEPVEDEDGNFVEINKLLIPKKSHEEKYQELNKTNKRYYDSIMAYAEKLEGCHRQPSANADSVFYGRTCIIKTQIKQGKVVCNFSMIDAGMKRMLKGEKVGGVKEKFTAVRVTSTDTLHIARQSVDFAYKMALEEKEFKHQQQLAKRREARKAKKEAAEAEENN